MWQTGQSGRAFGVLISCQLLTQPCNSFQQRPRLKCDPTQNKQTIKEAAK